MYKQLFSLCVAGVLLVSGELAFSQTQEYGTVVQDTYLRAARPDEPYGTQEEFLSGNDPGGWRTDALIQFDLPDVPPGEEVEIATLDLYNSQLEWANRGSAEFEARAIMFEWSEDDTWSTLEADVAEYGDTVYDAVYFEGVDPPHGTREDLFPGEWRTWDVTELVQAWYDGSIENNGLAVLGQARFTGQEEGAVIFPRFYSLDYADDSLHPVLDITFGSGGASRLQAGDVNMDLEFNFDDILAVLSAGKYETGNPATWAEGDWNGAPGGNPGNPPVGDGLFDFNDILAALSHGLFETGSYAAISSGGSRAVNDRDIDLHFIPEPSSFVLLCLGLSALGALRVRRGQAP